MNFLNEEEWDEPAPSLPLKCSLFQLNGKMTEDVL